MKYTPTYTDPETFDQELWNVAVWSCVFIAVPLVVVDVFIGVSLVVYLIGLFCVALFLIQYGMAHDPRTEVRDW